MARNQTPVVLGLLVVSQAFGCVSTPLVDSQARARSQIESLEKIAGMEKRITDFVLTFPRVQKAIVKVRPGKAILIIGTRDEKELGSDAVSKIYAFVLKETGLEKRSITIRLWRAFGGEK